MQATPTRPHTASASPILQYLLTALGIVVAAGLAGLATYAFSSRQTPIYQASAKLLADASSTLPNGLTTGIVFNSPNLDSVAYREAALSQEVVGRTLKSLGVEGGNQAIAQFRAKASVSVTTGSRAISDIYTMRYTDPDPQTASKFVNAWAGSFLQWDDGFVRGKLKTYIKDLEAQYRSLNTAARQLNNAQVSDDERTYFRQVRGNVFKDIQLFKGLEGSVQGSLRVLDEASPPNSPIAPRPRRNAVVAAFVTFVALAGLWLLYFTWVSTQRNPQAFEINL